MADSQSTQKWDALLALPGEEKVQGQLHESPGVFGKEAEQMRTQGHHDSMVEECRTKSKSSEELAFYKGLEQIFSGDPTSQANRGATEPKTSSPVSSQSTSTSDFLDSCPELYPSDLEEDLEGEDSFMLSFCPLGQDTQDTDFAFPANVIDTAPLGQRNGSSSSQPVAHADKVNETCASRQIASLTPAERLALIRKRREESTCEKMACAIMNPLAVMTPAKRLALIKRKKVRDSATAAIEKITAHSAAQMSSLLAYLREEKKKDEAMERQSMDFMAQVIAEDRESLQQIASALQSHNQIMQNMYTLLESQGHQGNVGSMPRKKRIKRSLGSMPQPANNSPSSPPLDLQESQGGSTASSGDVVPGPSSRPIRKIKKPVTLSP